MNFKKYHKIHRLGKDETIGILNGVCHIQEKIDGANASIWLDDHGDIHCGSRNNDVTDRGDGFNGLVEYVKNHQGIKDLLKVHPEFRLYGEYLVKHTIRYNETAYNHFYLFDIEDGEEFVNTELVYKYAEKYDIKTPHYFGQFHSPDEEFIKEMVGESKLGDKGEGVVIKNFGFENTFGDTVYAKIVTQEFKERNNIVFGGNNKSSDTYWEMYVVNKYCTLPRVKKIMQKLESEKGKLDFCDTSRLTNTVYHDMLTEEIWEIQKKVPMVDLKKLKALSFRKAKQIFHDTLYNFNSVAYEN